jgi:hypothetical protein
LAGLREIFGKGGEGAGESPRIDEPQQPREGVVARRFVIGDQPRQRLPALASKQGKRRRTAGATKAGRNHHHHEVAKPVACIGRARIRQRAEIAIKARHGSCSSDKNCLSQESFLTTIARQNRHMP